MYTTGDLRIHDLYAVNLIISSDKQEYYMYTTGDLRIHDLYAVNLIISSDKQSTTCIQLVN